MSGRCTRGAVYLLVTVAVVAAAGRAYAGANVFTSGGPYGGAPRWLAVDPLSPTTVYAAMDTGGLFKSTDAGATWVVADTGLGGAWVTAVIASPTAPGTLYAGTDGGGVYRSTNGGASWVRRNAGLPQPYGQFVKALVLLPASETLYAATDGAGIFTSLDAGGTWTAASTGLTDLSILSLAIDPALPTTLYAGARGGLIVKSTNAGDTWATVRSGLDPVSALAIPPNGSATVHAGTYSSTLRSTDAGATWTTVATRGSSALLVDPSAPSTVYSASSSVYMSTDAGSTWASSNVGLPAGTWAYSLASGPGAATTLYVGTYRGLFKSTNSGALWTSANVGLTSVWISTLELTPDAGTLYAGTDNIGVVKSTDSGATWAAANGGMSRTSVTSLAIDHAHPATLYGATFGDGIFKSTDAGASWTPANAGIGGLYCRTLAIDPVTPSRLYAGIDGPSSPQAPATVYRSDDGGMHWAAISTGLPSGSLERLAVDPATPMTLYAGLAGSAGGFYKSTNGGVTWAPTSYSGPVRALAIDPTSSNILYAGGATGASRSTDGGATWTPLPLGLSFVTISALAVDSTNPATLYAGTYSGLLKSTDAGNSWGFANRGLPGPNAINALAIASRGATTVYAGLYAGSVWQASPTPVALAKGDLDGDGLPDLLFRNQASGVQHKVWFMDGPTRRAETPIAPDAPGSDWALRGVDDFNNDGRNDLLFLNRNSGTVEFWLMNDTTRLGSPIPLTGGPTLDASWELAATGDFDRDGQPDLVWRNLASQKIAIWLMADTRTYATVAPTPDQAVASNWSIVAALDYNHDGYRDFLWYNLSSGKLVTWYMDASLHRITGQFLNPPNAGANNWRVLASGDYSRSYTPPPGSNDVVWRNETSGRQVIWHLDFASNRVLGQFTSPDANTPPLDWTIAGPR